jgi:hypothetical protein
MMPVWLLYVKQLADFSAASKSLRSPVYSMTYDMGSGAHLVTTIQTIEITNR